MSTDPSQVRLTSEQQHTLADLADKAGKPWTLVFSEAIGEYQMSHVLGGNSKTPKAVFGVGRGLLTLSADFDAPLPELQEYSE